MYSFSICTLKLLLFGVFPFFSVAVSSWNPLVDLNEPCPVFVFGNSSSGGLGDSFERFLVNLYAAKLLNATLLYNGFGVDVKSSYHDNFHEYERVMKILLGYNIVERKNMLSNKYDAFKKFSTYHYRFNDVIAMSRNGSNIPCFTIISCGIGDCGGWCTITQPNYKFLDEVSGHLKEVSTNPLKNCIAKNFSVMDVFSIAPPEVTKSFSQTKNPIYITWHIRSGDACWKCGLSDINYYTRLYSHITGIIHSISSSFEVYLALFTANPMRPEDVQAFVSALPNSVMVDGLSHSLEETLCQFFFSDIHITGGSSMSNLLVFGRDKPLIIDAERKEKNLEGYKNKTVHPSQYHIFSNHSAVLLDQDGVPLISDAEFTDRIKQVLRMKKNRLLTK